MPGQAAPPAGAGAAPKPDAGDAKKAAPPKP